MKIHELLAKPEAWTRGRMAKDATNASVAAYNDRACAWCLLGAVSKCYSGDPNLGEIITLIARAVAPNTDTLVTTVIDYNDAPERTHAEVLALVKKLDV